MPLALTDILGHKDIAAAAASTTFENDPRRQREIKAQPYFDAIYRSQWKASKTTRVDPKQKPTEEPALTIWKRDIAGGIDCTTRTVCGQTLYISEKALSASQASFKTITVEYEQDPTTGVMGDWEHCMAGIYAVGYYNEAGTGFQLWVLVDYPRLQMETYQGRVKWTLRYNGDGHARSSFMSARVADLPPVCIIAKGGNWEYSRGCRS